MRLLIVTPEPDLRGYLRCCLESLSPAPAVVEATDGAAALERLREGPCDLVISDLDQPRMNGLELARALASSPVRVLLLSAELSRERTPPAGACGVLPMPFSRQQITERVAELLSDAGAPPHRDETSSLSETTPRPAPRSARGRR